MDVKSSKKVVSSAPAWLEGIRHVALDLDGTVYRGKTLFKYSLPFLDLLTRLDIGYTFLTNNPSRSHADYLAKLHGMGIPAAPEQVYTSALSTVEYLKTKQRRVRKLFLLGTPSMAETFADAGYALMPDDPKRRPDAVVAGFDPTMTYSRLCRAAWWISRGVPWFATNPDNVCPTDEPTVLVDCGSITAALKHATGRAPVAVLGKPDVAMLGGILRRHKLRAAQLAMVGDRLYTDIAMAQRAGARSVLVLTGETTAKEAAVHRPKPDMIAPTLAEFGRGLWQSRQTK